MLSGVLPDNPRKKKKNSKSERIGGFMSYWEQVLAKPVFWGSGVVTLHMEDIL